MKSFYRFLLILEVLVCFGYWFILLAAGLLIVPLQIEFLRDGRIDALLPIFAIICGLLGVYGLVAVIRMLFRERRGASSLMMVRASIVVGFLPIIGLFVISLMGSAVGDVLLTLLPLGSGVHLIYLARNYLFRHATPSVE